MSLLLAGGAAPPAAEAETLAPLSVRLGYRGYTRALAYVWNPARDVDVAAPVEESTLASFLVRLPYRNLGRSRYLSHTANDLSVVAPLDTPSFLAKPQYKALGRNPYLFRTAQDLSFVEPFDLPSFLAKPQFRQLGRNLALIWSPAGDVDVVAPQEDTWQPFLVRKSIESLLLGQKASSLLHATAQDFDAPAPVVESDTWLPFVVRLDLTSRFRGALIAQLLLSRGTAQDEDAPAPPAISGGVYIPTFRTRRGR